MRKGQAAVEYLTTYGWAILALVIVLAVLTSSGVLSPNVAISEECTFGSNVPCDAVLFNSGTATQISIRLFNGFPYKIKVASVDLRADDGTKFSWAGTDVPPLELESGANVTLSGNFGRLLPENSVQKFSGNLTYVSCAPEIGIDCSQGSSHSMTGRVTGKILPK